MSHIASSSGITILKRRSLLKAAAISSVAAIFAQPLRALAAEGDLPYLDALGLQLYTVRNQMAQDPESTLKAVAQAGYKQVELQDINNNAVQYSAIARDNGMAVHSGFMNWQGLTSPNNPGGPTMDETIELANRIGMRHIIFGYIGQDARNTADKIKAITDTANAFGEKVNAAGMRLSYHNHSFEFGKIDGDQTTWDLFLERFEPVNLGLELDVFWAKIGGNDPAQMMRDLAGRITQVHLKNLKAGMDVTYDEGAVPADAFQEVGDGVIDMPAIMNLAKEIGVDICHVEQDQSPAPLDSIVESVDFLKSKSAG